MKMLVYLCYSCLRIRQLSLQNVHRNLTSNYLLQTDPTGLVSARPKGRVIHNQFKDFKLFYSFDSVESKKKGTSQNETEVSNKKKPKKEIKTYITLVGVDNNISITTVEDATKLATRRNLKLVKVVNFDPKTSRAVYQIMTGSQYLKEDKEWENANNKKEKSIKGDKVISFSSSINEHDVLTKTKMMKKWLAKKIEVRVVITGDATSSEKVYKIIEKDMGIDGRIVQKRIKGTDIRFQILPPKKSEEKKLDSQDSVK